MGFVDGADRVIGFEPHAMATVPPALAADHETWKVVSLELVSLLKHDAPRVYVSDHLPNLSELDELPTRPLDDFEETRLRQLQDGEEIATAADSVMIRMLGAVRAGETCLACHSVPQRTLLGAFTYEIRPLRGDSERLKGGTSADRSNDRIR
jgi:hypothetical protein